MLEKGFNDEASAWLKNMLKFLYFLFQLVVLFLHEKITFIRSNNRISNCRQLQ